MKSSFANNECSSFIFEENHVEGETTQSNNVVTVEEEQDGIDIDGIGNLLDLLIGIIWIYLCSSMKNVGIVDGSLFVDDSLQEIMTERGSQKFYKPIYIYVHSLANAMKEIEVSMMFLVVTFFVGR